MSELDKLTTEKPYSSVPLKTTKELVPDIKEPYDEIVKTYKYYDVDAEKCYKKGTVIKVANDTLSYVPLLHIVNLYLDGVRDKIHQIESPEERNKLLIEVSRIQNSITALFELLNKDDFLLDINSVVHIIHGYISTNVQPIFQYYETRRRTTYRHDS